MNSTEARQLAGRILRGLPQMTVTGQRHYGTDDWALDVVDTRIGVPTVIYGVEQWDETMREIELWRTPQAP